MREEGVKLAKPRCNMFHPSGGESINAGETFSSLEMESHYPQQSIKYSVPVSPPPCMSGMACKRLNRSHMTLSVHLCSDWLNPQKQCM